MPSTSPIASEPSSAFRVAMPMSPVGPVTKTFKPAIASSSCSLPSRRKLLLAGGGRGLGGLPPVDEIEVLVSLDAEVRHVPLERPGKPPVRLPEDDHHGGHEQGP